MLRSALRASAPFAEFCRTDLDALTCFVRSRCYPQGSIGGFLHVRGILDWGRSLAEGRSAVGGLFIRVS